MVEPLSLSRRLIVIAVDDYADGVDGFTQGIADQVKVVEGWLTDPGLGPDRQYTCVRTEMLETVQELRAFLHEVDLASTPHHEAVVVYVTGHGLRGQASGRHYLTFPGTKAERLPGTALQTMEIIGAALGSASEHVLVMVDSCFAGSLDLERGVAMDLGSERRELKGLGVVTAGDFGEQPRVGEFTSLIQHALDELQSQEQGFAGPHLSFAQWERLLHATAKARKLMCPQWIWPGARTDEPSACLPNPRYLEPLYLPAPAVRGLTVPAFAAAEHWLERASGRVGGEDAGWYFRGRGASMRRLVDFVEEGSGVMVVTGSAGSGKSALLARLVTLSDSGFLTDPRFEEITTSLPDAERPAPGSVTAAVLGRNKTSADLLDDLLAACEAPPVPPEGAPLQVLVNRLAHLSSTGRPVTIVIDGLDEAQQPLACLNDVVLPLARQWKRGRGPLLRLLLGVRSSPVGAQAGVRGEDTLADQVLGALMRALCEDRASVPTQQLRTDGPECGQDIASYAGALLTGPGDSPYAGDERAAGEAARAIAAAVAPSFLDARLAADQLRRADGRQDLADGAWLTRLVSGTTALLRQDLREVAAHSRIPVPVLVAVLRATALAFGTGLPWAEVWPAVAGALEFTASDGARDNTEVDFPAAIRAVHASRLIGYLATDEEDSRITYRPVHQRVTETLALTPHELLTEDETGLDDLSSKAAHARITDALAVLAQDADPLAAHPYVRRHYVDHAAVGEVLNDLHIPAVLLAQDTSGGLRARLGLPLPADDPQRRLVTAAAVIEPFLAKDTARDSRLASIAFHTRSLGADPLPHPPLVRWRWGDWSAATNVIASPAGHVHALAALAAPDGRPLVAVGTKWDGVQVWDTFSGQHLATINTGRVSSITVVRANGGRELLATASPRGVGVWDPLSGLRLAWTAQQRARSVRVLADGHRRWKFLINSGRPGATAEAKVWSPDARRVRPLPLPFDQAPQLVVTLDGADGNTLVVTSPDHQRLYLQDDDGAVMAETLLPHRVRAILGVRRGLDSTLLVAISTDHMTTWDPFTGELRTQLCDFGPSHLLLQLPGDGPAQIAISTGDSSIEVWALDDDGRWHSTAHDNYASPVRALTAFGTMIGTSELVTASDSEVQLWSSTDGDAWTPPPVHTLPRALCGFPISLPGHRGPTLAVASSTGIAFHTPENGRVAHSLSSNFALSLQVLQGHTSNPILVIQDEEEIVLYSPGDDDDLDWIPVRANPQALVTTREDRPGLIIATSGQLAFYDLHTRQTAPLRLTGRAKASAPYTSILVRQTPDGTPQLITCTRGRLEVSNLNDQTLITTITADRSVAFTALQTIPSADGELLAGVTHDSVHLWDCETWELRQELPVPNVKATAVAPTRSGAHLLVCGNGHSITFWDPNTGTLRSTLVTAAPVNQLATIQAPDRQTTYLAASGQRGLAMLALDL